MERAHTKQQILEMYLNTVFFGNDAYGSVPWSVLLTSNRARVQAASASTWVSSWPPKERRVPRKDAGTDRGRFAC